SAQQPRDLLGPSPTDGFRLTKKRAVGQEMRAANTGHAHSPCRQLARDPEDRREIGRMSEGDAFVKVEINLDGLRSFQPGRRRGPRAGIRRKREPPAARSRRTRIEVDRV